MNEDTKLIKDHIIRTALILSLCFEVFLINTVNETRADGQLPLQKIRN